MNRGVHGIDQSGIAAANALHGATTLRLIAAREMAEAKSARLAFTRPAARAGLSIANNILAEMPVPRPAALALTEGQEADLRSEIDAQVQKVLAIMAVMISEAGADIAAMNDLIDVIRVMDHEFFDFANAPENIALKDDPVALVAAFVARRRRKMA